MRGLTRWLAISVLLIGLSAAIALASGQARVSGTVVSTTGQPIADATITVTCPEAPTFKKVLEVEANGTFKLLLLDATKSYDFHVQAPGFAPYDHTIKVGIGTMDNEFTFTMQSEGEATAAQQLQLLQQPGYKELEEGLELMRSGQPDGRAGQVQRGGGGGPHSRRGLGRARRHRLPRRQPRVGPGQREVLPRARRGEHQVPRDRRQLRQGAR